MVRQWKMKLDHLAILVARACQWDLSHCAVRPHITPDQVEFTDYVAYGTMEYGPDPDAHHHLPPVQPATTTATATATDAMDTTVPSTSGQGAAEQLTVPLMVQFDQTVFHAILGGQLAMREAMDRTTEQQEQVFRDLAFERVAHKATKERLTAAEAASAATVPMPQASPPDSQSMMRLEALLAQLSAVTNHLIACTTPRPECITTVQGCSMVNPYTGTVLDQPSNMDKANRMDLNEESSMLLLRPGVAAEVMAALSDLADAMEGLVDLRPEEGIERKPTPPPSPREDRESTGDRLRQQRASLTDSSPPSGKGKTGKVAKPKSSQSKGRKEKTTPARCPVLSQQSTPATETSGSEYPQEQAPLAAKEEAVEIISINSDEDEDADATPQDAAADTELTEDINRLTVKEEPAEKPSEKATADATQVSPPLVTTPATADDMLLEQQMECDCSSHQETAPVTPQVLDAVGLQPAQPLPAAFTTGRIPHPPNDYSIDEEEEIDEDALLNQQEDGAEDARGTPEYQVTDEIGPSEDEEDPTTDP